MREVQPIVTDVRGVCPSIRLSVCLSRCSTRLHCTKSAVRIKMLFGMYTLGARVKFRVFIEGDGHYRKLCKRRSYGVGAGSRDALLDFETSLAYPERLKLGT